MPQLYEGEIIPTGEFAGRDRGFSQVTMRQVKPL